MNQVDICNLALARLGNNPIQALTDQSPEASICSLLYGPALASVLRDHDWSFARKYVQMALLTETHPKWAYVYSLPSDCAAAREIFNPASREARLFIPWEIGLSMTGNFQVVLTDDSTGILMYTANVQNSVAFDAIFADALAWRLAAEAAQPLRANLQISQSVANRYQQVLADAKGKSANEKKETPSTGGSYTDARNGWAPPGISSGVPWYACPVSLTG